MKGTVIKKQGEACRKKKRRKKDKGLGFSLSVISRPEPFISLACVGKNTGRQYPGELRRRLQHRWERAASRFRGSGKESGAGKNKKTKGSGSPRASRPQGIKTLSFCCTSASQCFTARAAINAGELLIQLIRVWMRRLLQAASGPNEEPAEWLWCPPLDFGYHSWMREIREIVIFLGKDEERQSHVHLHCKATHTPGRSVDPEVVVTAYWSRSFTSSENFHMHFLKPVKRTETFAHCEHLHYKTKCGPSSTEESDTANKKKKEKERERKKSCTEIKFSENLHHRNKNPALWHRGASHSWSKNRKCHKQKDFPSWSWCGDTGVMEDVWALLPVVGAKRSLFSRIGCPEYCLR